MFTKLIHNPDDCKCMIYVSVCCDCGNGGCGCSGCATCNLCSDCRDALDED